MRIYVLQRDSSGTPVKQIDLDTVTNFRVQELSLVISLQKGKEFIVTYLTLDEVMLAAAAFALVWAQDSDTPSAPGTGTGAADKADIDGGNIVVSSFKTALSLGNVNNTSDALKPISTSQQGAIDLKINLSEKGSINGVATLDSSGLVPLSQLPVVGGGGAVSSVAGKTGVVTLVRADVGLSNADNTSDSSKPVSTAQQTALDLKINTTARGAANGVASLDSSGLVPVSQLPSLGGGGATTTPGWIV
jgi:hypothetical protein